MKELLNQLKGLLSDPIPEVIDSLNAGASEEELRHTEEIIGYKLPDNVRELYKIHNGQSGHSGLFCGLPFISLEVALKEWQTWKSLAEQGNLSLDSNIISVPSNYIKEVYINTHYFPISKDFGGNNIVIDMDPDLQGQKGQVINAGRDEDMRFVISPDIAGFIKFIISQLESNNIRVEKEEEYVNWYLKSPANSHFLDTLKELELPYGVTIETKNDTFDAWVERLNPKWKACLEEEVGPYSSREELRKVKRLSLLNQGFSEIEPLREFTGLRELILTGNPLTDLSPLKPLKDLKKLFLAKTEVLSIDDITGLHNLTQLSLFNTQLNDLEGISKLSKLRSLSIQSTKVRDLAEIGKIKKLTELDISECNFLSFEPLRHLKSLKHLNISKTNIKDLTIIGELINLESLQIYDTNVVDFAALGTLTKLTSITCSYDYFLKIKDIMNHEVHFGIAGEMTEKQKKYWRKYSYNENGSSGPYENSPKNSRSDEGKPNLWDKLKKKWF